MPYEIIFAIPFIVGIAYVVYQSILYKREMEEWINHAD